MEWFYWIPIVFLVLSLISIAFTAYRYREYLKMGWTMFKMNRQFKKNYAPKNLETDAAFENQAQIQCDNCRRMVEQDNAVKLKNKYFCSHGCMEFSFAFKR